MPNIAAVILVGGNASRIDGQDKSALLVGSKSCLDWVVDIFENQVDGIALSIGQVDRYNHAKNYGVIFDWPSKKERHGVAYAILGSLAWAREHDFDAIITTPVDTPLLPQNYAEILRSKYAEDHPTVCKTSDGLHSLHAIWPVASYEKVKTIVLQEGQLKISKLHESLSSKELLFQEKENSKFLNINNEHDLLAARDLIIP